MLVRTRNPLNIGGVARAMANFGFSKLRLVAPYDLAFREARSAVHATDILNQAEVYDNVADAVADCHSVVGTTAGTNRQLKQSVEALPHAGGSICRVTETGKVAILFGSEKRGLSNGDLSYCQSLLRIPTAPEQPSMNLAQSVAVVLYELASQKANPDAPRDINPIALDETIEKAEMQTLHRLTDTMLRTLAVSGYAKPGSQPHFEEKLRLLLLRMQLSQADADTWTAMFRQILWKIEQQR